MDTPISGFAGTQLRQTGADGQGKIGLGLLASLRTSESDAQHNSERDVSTQADARPDKQFADAHANSFADESGRATRTESAAQELSAFGAEESASTLGARESEPAHVLAADPPREFTSTPAARAALPVDEELAIKIETRGGGLFCLINLALALELYGDFTTPLAPGLPLSLWDFVAMLGARLLKRELHDDPVWTLLAQLAGRDPRTAPGVDFAPPDEWRMPGAWLADLPRGGAWRWALLRDRLQVMHPSGFLVIDVPRDARPPVPQLAAEMEAYTDLHDGALLHATRGVRLRGSTTRARWLARLTAYVCVRLRHALGERETRTAARLLCLLPARIVATTTHLDVHVSLCDLPVAVRRAGLDRDPGWVPAAGRFIAFHFE